MESLIHRDGELYYIKSFIAEDAARKLHIRLHNELDWKMESITIAGKTMPVPRQVCWYGDPGVSYHYSGTSHTARGWTQTLLELKKQVESFTDKIFNSVLGNQYRDGKDSMGWHADNEKELGENPYIASLSFGDSRRFRLRHNKSTELFECELENGSLLIMAGSLQHHWRHSVPKTARFKGNRINLTFRNIVG